MNILRIAYADDVAGRVANQIEARNFVVVDIAKAEEQQGQYEGRRKKRRLEGKPRAFRLAATEGKSPDGPFTALA